MASYSLKIVDQEQFRRDTMNAELLGNCVWAEVLQQLFPGSLIYFAFYKGEELQATFFLQQRRSKGIRQIHTPLLTPWTEITWQRTQNNHLQRRLHLHLTSELAAWVEDNFQIATFKFAPSKADVRSFQWAGWSSYWRYSYQLKGSQEADAALRKKLRRQPDLQIMAEQPTAELHTLIEEALREHNFTSLPVELIYRWIIELVDREVARILVVRKDGRAIALQLLLEQDSWRGLWMQLTLPEYRSLTPGSHLVQSILQDNEQFKLDFLGADDPAIDEHKSAFGGELISYPEVLWFKSRWLRWLYNWRHQIYQNRQISN
jgi:hypothetical protein